MVKLQIDLDEEQDKIVAIHKIENKLETKEQAVKEIIKQKKECNHKFEHVNSIMDRPIKRIMQRCINCGIVKVDSIYPSGKIETTFSNK